MLDPVPLLSVSRLAHLVQEMVEDNFMQLRVEGEVSNWSAPASGHAYFTLKDEGAQIRCAIFRPQLRMLNFRPENGMKLVLGGRMSFYGRRGDIQLVAETLEPRGTGGLQMAFEQLKALLAAEGLFDDECKRSLPAHPRTVGIVTSGSGAALQDMLQILRRRACNMRIILCPVRVQGEGAAQEVARAIADLNAQGQADVLIVGRGGGSLEDLWAFNEEVVARAVAASEIPVISAVGHETDFSICDFVADLRAPTPSAAAELVVRSRQELEEHLDHLSQRLATQMRHRLRLGAERLEGLRKRLRSPEQILARDRRHQETLVRRLELAMAAHIHRASAQLCAFSGRLHALSPLQTLERGYCIALDDRGQAVRDAGSLRCGDRLDLKFARGGARVQVEVSSGL